MDGALTDGPTVRSGGPTTTDSGLEDGGTEGNERREKEWGEVGGEGERLVQNEFFREKKFVTSEFIVSYSSWLCRGRISD